MPAIPMRLLEPAAGTRAKPSQKVLIGDAGWPATKYETPNYLDFEFTGEDKAHNLAAFLDKFPGKKFVKSDGRAVARFSYPTI